MDQKTDIASDAAANPCHSTGPHGFERVLERTCDASPEKIWTAWMTPEILMQWCPPPSGAGSNSPPI